MGKYKLKSNVISVYVGGKIIEDKKFIFDTEGNYKAFKSDIENAHLRGFLDFVKEEGKASDFIIEKSKKKHK